MHNSDHNHQFHWSLCIYFPKISVKRPFDFPRKRKWFETIIREPWWFENCPAFISDLHKNRWNKWMVHPLNERLHEMPHNTLHLEWNMPGNPVHSLLILLKEISEIMPEEQRNSVPSCTKKKFCPPLCPLPPPQTLPVKKRKFPNLRWATRYVLFNIRCASRENRP